MGQRSRAKVRGVVVDDARGISPGAAALAVLAIGLGGMIVWNAFNGMHGGTDRMRRVTEVPAGASTHVVVKAPSKTPQTITISYNARVEDVQRELTSTGHFRGLVDGVMGKQTALAIRKYQSDNGLLVNGEVTRDLLDHIRYTRKVVAASEFTGSVQPVGAVAKPKPVKKTTPSAHVAEKRAGLPKVRDAQLRLKKLGYEIALITGEPDDELRAAILKFQMDNGLPMDGAVTAELLAALKVADASRSPPVQ
jgi:peptidoglycan hydrolase-like protein with peptidoglycan-binding domain